MIVIGEKLNSSIPKTYAAMAARDENALIDLIERQTRAGASYLDINTAMFGAEELMMMEWVISLALEHSGAGIMIDSLNHEVVKAALACCGDRKVIINSVSNGEIYLPTVRLAATHGCGIVLMPESKDTFAHILEDATALVSLCKENGVKASNIYIDVLTEAIASNDQAGIKMLKTVRQLMTAAPDCHLICGLSNISFGMPGRARLNATLLAMASSCGLDSVIADPINDTLRETVAAIDLLQGKDSYGMRYISCMRGVWPGDLDEDDDF